VLKLFFKQNFIKLFHQLLFFFLKRENKNF